MNRRLSSPVVDIFQSAGRQLAFLACRARRDGEQRHIPQLIRPAVRVLGEKARLRHLANLATSNDSIMSVIVARSIPPQRTQNPPSNRRRNDFGSEVTFSSRRRSDFGSEVTFRLPFGCRRGRRRPAARAACLRDGSFCNAGCGLAAPARLLFCAAPDAALEARVGIGADQDQGCVVAREATGLRQATRQ